MQNNQYSNKRIALNSVYLFIRSLISIFIGLYASRILLQKLGIEDYGVYSVVGGIVMMFNSLRTFFASSIQRFLNNAKGRNDNQAMNSIFCTGFEAQLIISGLFLVVMETAGIIAVTHLNLTEVQMKAAHIVFQLSVFSAIVSIMTVPYDAVIIANERMNAFATFSIIESILRLLIIYLIAIGPFSQIVNYAILAFLINLLMRFVNSAYCTHFFPESKFHWVWDKQLMKRMGGFAGWNFLGNTGFSLTHEGVNYILNILGGVTINAARAITYQIVNALTSLLGNVNVAFTPQINASAAEKDKSTFFHLLVYNAKTSFSFYVMLMVPAIIFSKYVVELWLGEVPEYVLSFLMAVSVYHLLRTVHVPIDSYYKSIGDLKYYQVTEICIQMLNIPVAYILLLKGMPFWSVFIGMSFVEIINHICIVSIATVKYEFPLELFVGSVYKPFLIISFISVVVVWLSYLLGFHKTDNILLILLIGVVVEIILCISALYIVLCKEERRILFKIVRAKKNEYIK